MYVRFVFGRSNEGWMSFSPPKDDYCRSDIVEKQTRLLAVYRGKIIGEVVTTGKHKPKYWSDKCLSNTATSKHLPRVGTPSIQFSGWARGPVYRPIVLATMPYYKDPYKWNKGDPPSQIFSSALKVFRTLVSYVEVWEEKDGDMKKVKLSYRDQDVLVSEAYANNRGDYLLGLHVNPKPLHVDVILSSDKWSDYWFYVNRDKSVRPLLVENRHPEGAVELKFLDAGDYDNDGRSEVIFFLSSYNEDGYVLFYDNFSKNAVFTWGYH
jgi:hypothetical protein